MDTLTALGGVIGGIILALAAFVRARGQASRQQRREQNRSDERERIRREIDLAQEELIHAQSLALVGTVELPSVTQLRQKISKLRQQLSVIEARNDAEPAAEQVP